MTRLDILPNQLLNVAIEHRLMHAETLAYMLHQLPFDHKVRKPRLPELVVRPVEPRMIEIPAGNATLGLAALSNQPVRLGQRVRSTHRCSARIFHRSIRSYQPRVSPVHECRGL